MLTPVTAKTDDSPSSWALPGRFSAILLMLLLGAGLAGCGREPPDTHPGQPVTKRKAVFKQILRTLEPLGMVVRNRKDYNQGEFLAGAKELQRLSTQPWTYFTPDSNYPPTRAKPEVWEKPAEFKELQQKFKDAADGLAKAAEGGNLDTIRPAFADVEKSCKTCHRTFRGGV